jgi:hypothetical protein
MLWDLSGVPALYKAITERIAEGPGQKLLSRLTGRALNLARGLRGADQVVSMRLKEGAELSLDTEGLKRQLDQLQPQVMEKLNGKLEKITESFGRRIDQANTRFLDRALESLMQHLEKHGDSDVWHYSPNGLRILLRSGYQVLSRQYGRSCEEIFAEAAKAIEDACQTAFSEALEGFSVTPPSVPNVPAPVALGQTIALDLQSAWWKSWWKRRRGYRSFSDDFYNLIKAETDPIIEEMKTTQAAMIGDTARKVLDEFLNEQREILTRISEQAVASAGDLEALAKRDPKGDRNALLDHVVAELDNYAA